MGGPNQDAIGYVISDFRETEDVQRVAVICVADGMTTLASPHLASFYAVRTAMTTFLSSKNPLSERPTEMILEANNYLLKHPTKQDFGTTLTTVVASAKMIHIANLGDDRVYQISGSQIRCLTNDHSRLAEQLGRNPSKSEAKENQKSKKLERSLGEKPFAAEYVFTHQCPVCEGETFIICTDGFWTEFEEPELLSMAIGKITASALAELAVQRDNTDDVSVVLLRF